jgi:hypothetical protein
MTNKDSLTQEQEISSLFENARIELDAIEELSQKEKKQVIMDLAKNLEGMIPTDTICLEIVTQLRGKVSGRFIREILEDKYKQKYRANNAKKQQKIGEQANLAALTPLNHEDVRNKEIAVIQDTHGRSTEETKLTPEPSQSISDVFNDNNWNSAECPSCKQLLFENRELREALEKASKLTTADNMHAATAALDRIHEHDVECDILDFEFCLSKKRILDGWEEPYVELSDGDLDVWFSGEIDRRDGRVISADIGRKISKHGAENKKHVRD